MLSLQTILPVSSDGAGKMLRKLSMTGIDLTRGLLKWLLMRRIGKVQTRIYCPCPEKKLVEKVSLNRIGYDLPLFNHLAGELRENNLSFSQYVWPTFSFS